MKRTLSILIIGLLFFTTLSLSFNEISSGDEGLDVGRIYGYTYQLIGWETVPIPFVLVKAGVKQDISDIFGYYELNNLPLGEDYEITANKFGYEDVRVLVELSYEEPELEINLLLTHKDRSYCSAYDTSVMFDKLCELNIYNINTN